MAYNLKEANSRYRTYLPYGYTWNEEKQQVEINPKQAQVVQLIYKLCNEDNLSTYEIARRLTGTPTKSGLLEWKGAMVRQILVTPTYRGGQRVYKREGTIQNTVEFLTDFPALITKEQFGLAISKLSRRTRNYDKPTFKKQIQEKETKGIEKEQKNLEKKVEDTPKKPYILYHPNYFGYKWDEDTQQYEIAPEDAETIRLIFKLCNEDDTPLNKIGKHLEGLGKLTKTGLKEWNGMIIRNILTNPLYYDGLRTPPVVSKETFELAKSRLAQRRRDHKIEDLESKVSKRDGAGKGIATALQGPTNKDNKLDKSTQETLESKSRVSKQQKVDGYTIQYERRTIHLSQNAIEQYCKIFNEKEFNDECFKHLKRNLLDVYSRTRKEGNELVVIAEDLLFYIRRSTIEEILPIRDE